MAEFSGRNSYNSRNLHKALCVSAQHMHTQHSLIVCFSSVCRDDFDLLTDQNATDHCSQSLLISEGARWVPPILSNGSYIQHQLRTHAEKTAVSSWVAPNGRGYAQVHYGDGISSSFVENVAWWNVTVGSDSSSLWGSAWWAWLQPVCVCVCVSPFTCLIYPSPYSPPWLLLTLVCPNEPFMLKQFRTLKKTSILYLYSRRPHTDS